MVINQSLLILGARQSGLSSALAACHHYGWVVIGNLPIEQLPLVMAEHSQVAITLKQPANTLTPEVLKMLLLDYPQLQVLLLDAPLSTLVLRAQQSDVPHYGLISSSDKVSLEAALHREQAALQALKNLCTFSLDTETLTPEVFRYKMSKILGISKVKAPQMTVRLWSFGYKYGMPLEADWVLDARFLTNPFYDPELRPLTGLDEPIQNYIMQFPEAQMFLSQTLALLNTTLPHYQQHGKDELTVAIGCTGGKHRSVTLIEKLHGSFNQLDKAHWPVIVYHREQRKWQSASSTIAALK